MLDTTDLDLVRKEYLAATQSPGLHGSNETPWILFQKPFRAMKPLLAKG
jgi:hypothetical protein